MPRSRHQGIHEAASSLNACEFIDKIQNKKIAMQREKLIEEVRKYSCLYDLSDPKYRDNIKKDEAWRQISTTLKLPESECKKIWLNLRESHRRAIKKKKTKSGEPASTTKRWIFEDEMRFLLPHYRERKTISSITDASIGEDDDDSDISSLVNDDSQYTTNTTQNEIQLSEEPETSEFTVVGPRSSACSDTSNAPINSKKRGIENDSASATLMKYLIDVKRNKEDEEIDTFFKSIAATVKKFSEYNQAIIKSKIFNAVSEMELKEIEDKQNYCGYDNPYIAHGHRLMSQGFNNHSVPTTSVIQTQDGVANTDVFINLNLEKKEKE